ncbi:hypothetical protein [Pinirhizobacter sp.]|uniref:hypothetical protein n=1 Tax=Pinirhizobacter sp. TaxID=2950432 RepID=UPI002F417830
MIIDPIPPRSNMPFHFEPAVTGIQGRPIPWCCERLTKLETTTARIDADVSQLKTDVSQLKTDVSQLKVDMAGVKERLLHMPTTSQLLVWGIGAAALVIGALWRIVAALLEAQNAALAAQLAKAIAY